MPFFRVDNPETGTSHVVHVRLSKRDTLDTCVFPDFDHPLQRCARLAVAVCDFPVGKVKGGGAATCDLPMCRRHQTSVAPDRDHCPKHVTRENTMNENDEKGPATPVDETPAPPAPESQGDGDAEKTEEAVGAEG